MKRGSIETYRLIASLPKRDIMILARNTCKHHHSYLAHPKCAFQEGLIITKNGVEIEIKEKIGFLDMENFSFQMKADMGFTLTYVIKELDGDIIKNSVTIEELRNKVEDKRLLQDFVKDIKKFTRVITYYGTGFDLPFLRTRCLMQMLDFPIYHQIYHTDLYYNIRNKFLLRSKSLKHTCDTFHIPAKATPFKWDTWKDAVIKGNETALNLILRHNVEDVISTELLWKKVSLFNQINRRSI